MGKRSLRFFGLFFVLLMFSGVVYSFFGTVGATTYYNWLDNDSFELNTNYVEDDSAESNSFSSGLVYGNFTQLNGCVFSSGQVHSGVLAFYSGDDDYLYYAFAEDYRIEVSDLASFEFWGRSSIENHYHFTVGYTDGTVDNSDISTGTANTWHQLDVLAVATIDSGKYIKNFTLYTGGYNAYFDDFTYMVYDGSSQDSVTWDSSPWYWYEAWWNPTSTQDALSSTQARSGSYSYYQHPSIYISGGTNYYAIPAYQDVDYLDGSTVQYVDCYVYVTSDTDCDNVTMRAWVQYSDYDTDYRDIVVDSTDYDSWVNVDFGQSWILDTKEIITFAITVRGDSAVKSQSEGIYCYIDDVGLWSSNPESYVSYSWEISPSPISVGAGGVQLYAGGTYTYMGSCYVNGVRTGDGNYTLFYEGSVSNGTISDGYFSFVIPSWSGTGTYITSLTVLVAVGSSLDMYTLQITWIGTSATPTPAGGDGEGSGWFGDSDFVWLLLSMFVMFAPALFFTASVDREDKGMAFFSGLFIGSGIMVLTGFAQFWFVLLSVLVLVMLVMTMLSRVG